MHRDRTFLARVGLLILFTGFVLPSLFFRSVRHAFQQKDHREDVFNRARRSLEENRSTIQQRGEALLLSVKVPSHNCVMPSFDEFPGDFMTQRQRQKYGGVIVHFLLAVYMFGALALVCDDYFVPSLEKITDKLHMHSDVAGATFMAAGSSAPELFTSIIGVFITESDIGLGTIVGSAVFNILFIVGVCGLFAGSTLRLSRWPLLRDSMCYLTSIAALVAISHDKQVYWYEALVLVCMYLMYVLIMYFNQPLQVFFEKLIGSHQESPDIELNGNVEQRKENGDFNRSNVAENQEVEVTVHSASPFSFPQGCISRILWITALPFICLFYVTIPDCRKNRWEKWFLVSFFLSVLWIAALSYVLVWMVTIIGFTLGIPDVIMGLTFMAAGSSVPDGISSLIVARQGDGDMAVSNTIGSNVFDILLCLGLPWLLKTTIVDLGGYVNVVSGSMLYTSISLFGTVLVTILCVAVNKWYLNKCFGMIFLLLYVVFIAVATLFELNLFGDFSLPPCQV